MSFLILSPEIEECRSDWTASFCRILLRPIATPIPSSSVAQMPPTDAQKLNSVSPARDSKLLPQAAVALYARQILSRQRRYHRFFAVRLDLDWPRLLQLVGATIDRCAS